MNDTLKIVVPLTPPSQNHYMCYRVATIHGKPQVIAYPAKEAKVWWRTVEAHSAGMKLDADAYEIAYVVYQGPNERGDVDNYGKCLLDSLVKSGVIDRDHKVIAIHGYKARDRENPRTEIFIRAQGQLSLLDLPMPTVAEVENW